MRIILLTLLLVFSATVAQAKSSITLYKGEAFQGESWTIKDDIKNLNNYSGWNDAAMSAIVNGGVWEVCTEANYQNCVVLQGDDMRDFHRMGLDYKISSLREVDFRSHGYNGGYGGYSSGNYDEPRRGGTYNGFSDDFFYNNGRMGGRQEVYIDDRQRDRQSRGHKDNRNGVKNIIWNTPSNGMGFLSPCQAMVQDAINSRTYQQGEITFNGSPNAGKAFDTQGRRFNYSCKGDQTFIWE